MVINNKDIKSIVKKLGDFFSSFSSLPMVLNLQVTLILGSKQGPVMLTMVPPSMCPFSGAKVKGKFVPTVKKIMQIKNNFL